MHAPTSAANAGAANEDMFLQAFDDVPKLNITTLKKLELELSKTTAIISNPTSDWDDRVKAFKHFRSLINSEYLNGSNCDFLVQTLKTLELAFQNNIRDLRSQVVRETCITIAHLSCKLQQKFSRMAEILLPSLIRLIPNSAGVISTSALVALRFIVQSTHCSRLMPIIRYQLTNSKSKEIRRALCEIAERIVTSWSPIILERCIIDLQEVIKLGICDSDESARQSARRTFQIFSEHFKSQAEKLYKTLDPQKQRMLSLNRGSGSTLSVNGTAASSSHTSKSSSSSSILNKFKNNRIPVNSFASPSSARSTSVIDVAAQRRARARALFIPSSTAHRPQQQLQQQHHPHHNNTSSQSSLHSQSSNHHHHAYQQQYLNNLTSNTTSNRLATASTNTTTGTTVQAKIPQYQPLTPQIKQQPPQQQPASQTKSALSKAAAFLDSLVHDNLSPNFQENQIVTATKYFHSVIEKSSNELVSSSIPEIMPPLISLAGHELVCVRKVATCALVSVHSKVGLDEMEPYLNQLTVTPRKMVDLYIQRSQSNNPTQISNNSFLVDRQRKLFN